MSFSLVSLERRCSRVPGEDLKLDRIDATAACHRRNGFAGKVPSAEGFNLVVVGHLYVDAPLFLWWRTQARLKGEGRQGDGPGPTEERGPTSSMS